LIVKARLRNNTELTKIPPDSSGKESRGQNTPRAELTAAGASALLKRESEPRAQQMA